MESATLKPKRRKIRYIEVKDVSFDNVPNDVPVEEVKNLEQQFADFQSKAQKAIVDLLKDLRSCKDRWQNHTMQTDQSRIGRVIPVRDGHVITDMWEPGELFQESLKRQTQVSDEIKHLEAEKLRFRKKRMSRKRDDASDGEVDELAEQHELVTQFRLQHLKRELEDLKAEERALHAKKKNVIREQKLRNNDCIRARLANCEQLSSRYVLMDILGKGGFGEVYKAFDLVALRYVACKIHQVNPAWQEERKEHYMRHAVHERQIQQSLDNGHMVKLYDTFGLDANAFCTVMEYCDSDLEQFLGTRCTLPEKEARSVMLQILSGVRYLHHQKPAIVHYDLKPANILFLNGEVKITDFGLSKQLPEGTSTSVEPLLHGMGTHSYLPPECLRGPPCVTTKVDIWSCGVIMYQMLFGVKPFAATATTTQPVEFPAKPTISELCGNFILRCLTHNSELRPDIDLLFEDPFVTKTKVLIC